MDTRQNHAGRLHLSASYGAFPLTPDEVPCVFVRVTLTLAMPLVLPLSVNVCANVNWLPYWSDVGSPYQIVKSGPTVIVCVPPCSVVPDAAWNVNVALTISRVFENPVTSTSMPPEVVVVVTFVITGACGAMVITCVGAGLGVTSCPSASKCSVSVIVPATVPVPKETAAGKTASV